MFRWALLVTLLLLVAGCAGRSGSADAPVDLLTRTAEGPSGSDSLPALPELPLVDSGRRVVSANYGLLERDPVLDSDGAVHTSGSVTLTPALNELGLSWAVYALDGFPLDGSILPQRIEAESSAPLWLGVADYGRQQWRMLYFDGADLTLADAADCISPTGVVYIAALAYPHPANETGESTLTKLCLVTGADVPGQPVANITFHSASGQGSVGLECEFSAEGSDPGPGTFSSFTFDWRDGSPTEQTTDPLETVSHVWNTPGPKSVDMTLITSTGASVKTTLTVQIGQPFRELLVVYNSDLPESADLADYYGSVRYGRSIHPDYRIGLPLGATEVSDIDRADYESQIRDPLRAHLDASGYKHSLKYILLCKGVPHRIPGVSEFDYTESTYASVDSELCLLYSDHDPVGWIWNGPTFEIFNGDGYYAGVTTAGNELDEEYSFSTGSYAASSATETFPVDYLVGRLAAYTFEEAKLLVDRSLNADTSGTGWAIMDTISNRAQYDTMADPVWPVTNDELNCGMEVLTSAGFSNFLDTTAATLKGDGDLPNGAAEQVIANVGWGVNHGGDGYPSGAEYILYDLEFTYLPGAMWMSYESFNGTDFNDADGISRRGQGQIADFLREGGTVAIGNAWEPWTIGVGDERVVMYRYLVKGDRWIEAAYKGLRLLSWQQVVVGDPLCTVR